MQTLDELRADNAKEEEEAKDTPQVSEEETETEAVEEESKETETDAESEDEEIEETETEAWTLIEDDDQGSNAELKFNDNDMATVRKKYKSKLEQRTEANNEELNTLRAKVEQLEQGKQQAPLKSDPKYEDFIESDDQNAAYIDAVTDQKMQSLAAKQQAQYVAVETKRKQQLAQQEINTNVDQHYKRVKDIAEKSGIKAETYHDADLSFRKSVESVFPDNGNKMAEALISNVGPGSEKTILYLYNNPSKRSELMSFLATDMFKAVSYLGRLTEKLEFNTTRKRTTNAQKPAKQISGDEQNVDTFKKLKSKYAAAHKKGDHQEAFNLRMSAKKAGANVGNW